LAGEEREEAGSLAAPRNDNQKGKGNSKGNSNSNSKGSLVEVLLSHVSDDEAVASVGHPGGGGGAGEEREEAGSLAALGMTTRKARARTKNGKNKQRQGQATARTSNGKDKQQQGQATARTGNGKDRQRQK